MKYLLTKTGFALFAISTCAILVVVASRFTTSEHKQPVLPAAVPGHIRNLGSSIRTLSSKTTLADLGSCISNFGLNAEPDHWKDFNYYWSIPSAESVTEQYVLTAYFRPNSKLDGQLCLQSAAIRLKGDGPILSWVPVWQTET